MAKNRPNHGGYASFSPGTPFFSIRSSLTVRAGIPVRVHTSGDFRIPESACNVPQPCAIIKQEREDHAWAKAIREQMEGIRRDEKDGRYDIPQTGG